MDLYDYNTIKRILTRHGFTFSKALGQNFLIDPSVCPRMAAALEADDRTGVLEIGPGIGVLTKELSAVCGRVAAVELDRRLWPVLEETMAGCENFTLVQGDVMQQDLAALVREHFGGLRPILCANLPYNITTPLLTRVVESRCFDSVTVLIQKEAAQRFTAPQGSPEIGAFPLQLQYRMETELLFDVEPECFLPRPKVTSTVLRCVRRQRPAVAVRDEALFQKVLKGAFLLRRKTLSNSLASALPGFSKEEVQAAIQACGLPATVRGEALSLAEFAALTEVLAEARG